MAPTRDVNEGFKERFRTDPEFGDALLDQIVECLLDGEINVGKRILRDYIDFTTGLEQLSRLIDEPSDSLRHMLKPDGNPETGDLVEVISRIREHTDTCIEANAVV